MIEIDYPDNQKIYCPACGTLTLSLETPIVMNECPHLEFLGTDEGPEIEKTKWYAQWEEHRYDDDPNDDTHFMEYLRKTWDDHYVWFYSAYTTTWWACWLYNFQISTRLIFLKKEGIVLQTSLKP